MSVKKEMETVKQLVEHILESKPKTRNSDTLLYLEACKYLGAETLDDIETINLNVISIHKIRQIIQNKEGRFLPDENIKTERANRRWEIRDWIVAGR